MSRHSLRQACVMRHQHPAECLASYRPYEPSVFPHFQNVATSLCAPDIHQFDSPASTVHYRPTRAKFLARPTAVSNPRKPLETIKGLTRFQKAIGKTTVRYVRDVVHILTPPLLSKLHDSKKEFQPFIIQPLVSGTDESSAKLCIAVFCPEGVRDLVESICENEATRHLHQFDAAPPALFDLYVIPSSRVANGFPPTVVPEQLRPAATQDLPGVATLVATKMDGVIGFYSPAVGQLASLFQESKVLEPLHNAAINNLGAMVFERLYRELLIVFVDELTHKAQHPDGRRAGEVLRVRSNRALIAQSVTNQSIGSSTGSSHYLELFDNQPSPEELVDEWPQESPPTMSQSEENRPDDSTIGVVSEYPPSKVISEYAKRYGDVCTASNGDWTRDWIHNNNKYDARKDDTGEQDLVNFVDIDSPFPDIASVRSCLYQASAFQNLALELRLSALPIALRQILTSTPKSLIQLRSGSDNSVLNKVKAYIEDRSKLGWDWWPLQPRVHDIPDARYRLGWEVSTSIDTSLFSMLNVLVWW